MMTICSVFLLLSDKPDKIEQRDAIWAYLKERNPGAYREIGRSFLGLNSKLPGTLGRKGTIFGYHLAQKIYKFN